jgi:hypothetical protein
MKKVRSFLLASALTAVAIGLTASAQTVIYEANRTGGPGTQVPGEVEGTTFTRLGSPALNNAFRLAFTATFTGATGSASGIFDGATIFARRGDAAPGISGATFSSFRDPAISDFRLAYIANLTGAVTSATNRGLFTRAANVDSLVQQEGAAAPEIPGAIVRVISSYSMSEKGVISYVASLVVGPGGVTTSDDVALFQYNSGVSGLLLREGQTIGTKTVLSFVALRPSSNTTGQRRGVNGSTVLARVNYTDGTEALLSLQDNQTPLTLFATDDTAPGATTSFLAKFGQPIVNSGGTIAFLGSVTGAGVVPGQSKAIFADTGDGYQPVAYIGSVAPGLTANVAYLKDPIYNAHSDVAVVANLKGTGVTSLNRTAILYFPSGRTAVTVARTGDEPPGATGATWKAFRSVALPDGLGPLFVATLTPGVGGVDGTNDIGLWASTTAGTLQLLLREGDLIDGKTVQLFTVLKPVIGATDQNRSFNSTRKLALLVKYTDNTSAIVRIDVP